MLIQGSKVIIRAIEKEDLVYLKDSINSSELEHMEIGANFPISMFGQEKWLNNLDLMDSNNHRMIIEYEGKVVGYTCLINIDWKNRVAHTGIKLFSKEYRGKGLGEDAVMAIMKFSFKELNLNRLEGFMIDYNSASLKLYIDKCGWKQEGIKRKYVYKDGEYHDLVIVGILQEDYDCMIKNRTMV